MLDINFSDIGFSIISTLMIAIVVVVSLVLHEIAHGYVALWNGDYTAKINGRLSLNPFVHFDIIGFIMLMVVGFGYAKPVPVNPYNFKHQKRGIFTVAIAGVLFNLLLAFLSFGLMMFFGWLMVKFPNTENVLGFFRLFFNYMVTINLGFMLFNLLPIYPLDGFRVIEAFTRFTNPVTKFLRDYGQFILIALVGMSIVVRMFNLPFYLDILGFLISQGRNLFANLFGMFWGLIF